MGHASRLCSASTMSRCDMLEIYIHFECFRPHSASFSCRGAMERRVDAGAMNEMLYGRSPRAVTRRSANNPAIHSNGNGIWCSVCVWRPRPGATGESTVVGPRANINRPNCLSGDRNNENRAHVLHIMFHTHTNTLTKL